LKAEDNARLEAFLSPLRPMVELARESIPILTRHVSTIEVLLSTPLPAPLKDKIRPHHRRASQCLNELQNVLELWDSITTDTTYDARRSASDFITQRTSGLGELLNEIQAVLSSLQFQVAEGIVLRIEVQS